MVDSSVPFIATGQIGEAWAVVILEEIVKQNIEGRADTFSLQEILDRFDERGNRYEGRKMYEAFRGIVPDAVSVRAEDFDRAAELFSRYPEASPRDLLHAAVAERTDIRDIFSIDGPAFDNMQEIRRVRLPILLQELNLKNTHTYERKNISRS